MNNKIIGFTIARFPIDHRDVDVFDVGLEKQLIRHGKFYIYLWGVGDLLQCRLGNRIACSFPLHFSFDDRNVVITLSRSEIKIENDWLGSIPVFYNKKAGIVSTLIHKATTDKDRSIHPEGLNNYLDFGYAVLGQTPLTNIEFMRYFSTLVIKNGKITISHKPDTFLKSFKATTNPKDVIKSIKNYIRAVEKKVRGDIIIPTSGGFDSRLLNIMVGDKKRIKAFTYGLSDKQGDSFEVVKAEKIAKTLKIRWQQIKLGQYNHLADLWYKLYGCSTHLHGMYHIEFFKKIRQTLKHGKPHTLLSGIFGDVWSGFVDIPEITDYTMLPLMGYRHGLHFDSSHSLIKTPDRLRKHFFNSIKPHSAVPQYRIVTAIRLKIILISYLMSLPDYFSFPSWTPFLNQKIVLSILCLPDSQKQDRIWEQDFFASYGLDLERRKLSFSMENNLDAQALRNHAIPALHTKKLSGYIHHRALKRLNREYHHLLRSNAKDRIFINKLIRGGLIGPYLISLGFKEKNYLQPYNQLVVLKAIELALKQD